MKSRPPAFGNHGTRRIRSGPEEDRREESDGGCGLSRVEIAVPRNVKVVSAVPMSEHAKQSSLMSEPAAGQDQLRERPQRPSLISNRCKILHAGRWTMKRRTESRRLNAASDVDFRVAGVNHDAFRSLGLRGARRPPRAGAECTALESNQQPSD